MKISPQWHVRIRYTLFQLPGIALVGAGLSGAVQWWDLPPVYAAVGLGLWVVKDAAMYPLVRHAYEPGNRGAEALVGTHGVAEEPLVPDGWVRVGPELWRAELSRHSAPAPQGTSVRVIRVHGLVLEVERDG